MTIVLFDVDGTLTATDEVDSVCFAAALSEHVGCAIDDDWANYVHVTDAGIAREAIERHLGAPPGPEALDRARRRFVQLYREATFAPASRPGEVPGAAALLQALTAERDVPVGLATGGWRASAELKLRHAGLDRFDLSLATSDDAEARIDVMRIALARVAARRGLSGSSPALYVGDGVWDARAARQLGWPFIGVGAGARAGRLLAEGARAVVPDFLDQAVFLGALRACGLDLPEARR
jgi:phosphoglycolate phosphatase-like HAD superfamily hydrolase